MKKKFIFLMLMPVILTEAATEQIDVNVTFDANGVPQSATGQKQLVDESKNVVPDGSPNTLTISDSAKQNYATAIAAANQALQAEIVAENYTNGVFNTPPATESTPAS